MGCHHISPQQNVVPVHGLRGIFSMEFYDIKSIAENAVLFDTVVSINQANKKCQILH